MARVTFISDTDGRQTFDEVEKYILVRVSGSKKRGVWVKHLNGSSCLLLPPASSFAIVEREVIIPISGMQEIVYL